MIFHCPDNLENNLKKTQSPKWVVLLRNWLVSAEKPCWYPHDDVTVRKPMSLSFLQQQADKKTLHAVSSNVLKSHVSEHIFLTYEECKFELNNFFLTFFSFDSLLCLHEAACFIIFNSCLMLSFLSPTRNAFKSLSCTRPSLYPYLPSFDTNKIL